MNDSSLADKTVYRKTYLVTKSDLDIESLGRLISENLVGGLPFEGLEKYIRDEIPAIYINGILGCRLILLGFPGEPGDNRSSLVITELGTVIKFTIDGTSEVIDHL
jgi:hypothetical protein